MTDFNINEDVREQVEGALEAYEKDIGFLDIKIEQPEYIYMSLDELRKKTPEQLVEANLEIARYSLYIQRVLNKLRSWEKWGMSKLNEIAAHNLPKIGSGYGFNEREILAKNGTETCQTLNAFLRGNKMKLERLTDVPVHLKIIGDAIRDMKFVALKRESSE